MNRRQFLAGSSAAAIAIALPARALSFQGVPLEFDAWLAPDTVAIENSTYGPCHPWHWTPAYWEGDKIAGRQVIAWALERDGWPTAPDRP